MPRLRACIGQQRSADRTNKTHVHSIHGYTCASPDSQVTTLACKDKTHAQVTLQADMDCMKDMPHNRQICSRAYAQVHQPAECAATLLRQNYLCAASHSRLLGTAMLTAFVSPASMSLKSAGLVWIIGNASVVTSATCSQRQPVSDAMLLPCRHTQGDQPCSKYETAELQL